MKQFDIQKKECSWGDKISIQNWLVVSNIFFHPHLTHSANGPALKLLRHGPKWLTEKRCFSEKKCSTYPSPKPPRKLTCLAGRSTTNKEVFPIENWWIFHYYYQFSGVYHLAGCIFNDHHPLIRCEMFIDRQKSQWRPSARREKRVEKLCGLVINVYPGWINPLSVSLGGSHFSSKSSVLGVPPELNRQGVINPG